MNEQLQYLIAIAEKFERSESLPGGVLQDLVLSAYDLGIDDGHFAASQSDTQDTPEPKNES